MFIHTSKQAKKQADVNLTDHRIDLISRLVCALVQIRSVNLKKLAYSLSGPAQIESHYRRLQLCIVFSQMEKNNTTELSQIYFK